MRFKIQGEKEEADNKTVTTVVEILGKNAIAKLVDDKIYEVFKELNEDIIELKKRVDKLEEELSIYRREINKLISEDG